MQSLVDYDMERNNEYIRIIGQDKTDDATVKTKDYVIENLHEILQTIRDSNGDVYSYCYEKQYIREYYDWLYGNVPIETLPKDLVLFTELKNKGE